MLVVQKYGGSSLATPKHIQRAAQRIAEMKKSGVSVVIVASAMGHMTDHLLKLAEKTVKVPPPREVDMLLTAGERISMSLLSMALLELGIPAISFTGSQSGIITNNDHTEAKIIDIRPNRIIEELNQGKVVIIAGFQGVSEKKEITTLGRGGSDTTAIALAAVLKADRCEILTDVDGLYSADPRIVPEAKVLTSVDYDSALEMASLGAKMQARSIELAKKYKVDVRITSSHSAENKGTQVFTKDTNHLNFIEQIKVSAVASKTGFNLFRVKISFQNFLSLIKDISIPMRFITQASSEISFLCEREKLVRVREILNLKKLNFTEEENVVAVSLVGEGLVQSNPLFYAVLGFMEKENIDCLMTITSSASITFVVKIQFKETLSNFFHSQFVV